MSYINDIERANEELGNRLAVAESKLEEAENQISVLKKIVSQCRVDMTSMYISVQPIYEEPLKEEDAVCFITCNPNINCNHPLGEGEKMVDLSRFSFQIKITHKELEILKNIDIKPGPTREELYKTQWGGVDSIPNGCQDDGYGTIPSFDAFYGPNKE